MSDFQICRLCARYQMIVLDIAASDENGCTLMDLIRQYLALKVVEEEGYPSVVCEECRDTLTSFHQFANRCREAQSTFEDQRKVKLELCKHEEFKFENMKQEYDTESINQVLEGFDCTMEYTDWEPLEPVKVHKKRGRKPKLRASNGSTCEELIKLENFDSYDPKPLKRSYTKSGKYKKNMNGEHRIKRHYTKKITAEEDFQNAKYECYICGDTTPATKAQLRDHEVTHFTQDNFQWPCMKCDKTFKEKAGALRHIRMVHEGAAGFICHECGHILTSKGNLDEHLKSHSDKRPYQCDQCHKRFKGKPCLKRHMDTHRHTGYRCPKCSLLLNSRVTLRNHMHIHDEVGRQKCNICTKRFKTRKALKVHVLTHTGERPFSCPWCPKTFANNSNCRIHKKRVHMPELMKFEADRAKRLANQLEMEEHRLTPVNCVQENVNYDTDSCDLSSVMKFKQQQQGPSAEGPIDETETFQPHSLMKSKDYPRSSDLTHGDTLDPYSSDANYLMKSRVFNCLINKKL